MVHCKQPPCSTISKCFGRNGADGRHGHIEGGDHRPDFVGRLRGVGGGGGDLWGWGAHPPPGQGRQGQGAKAERRLLAAEPSSCCCSECAPPPSTLQRCPVDGCTIHRWQGPVFQPHSDTRQSASTLMSTLISFPDPKTMQGGGDFVGLPQRCLI